MPPDLQVFLFFASCCWSSIVAWPPTFPMLVKKPHGRFSLDRWTVFAASKAECLPHLFGRGPLSTFESRIRGQDPKNVRMTGHCDHGRGARAAGQGPFALNLFLNIYSIFSHPPAAQALLVWSSPKPVAGNGTQCTYLWGSSQFWILGFTGSGLVA